MKKIKSKSLAFLGNPDKSIDIFLLSNGEYICEMIDHKEQSSIVIYDSHIDVFLDKLKDYPKAVELACEVFFAEIMEEPCGYDKAVWDYLKRIYERGLNTIIQEINKEEKYEHIRN